MPNMVIDTSTDFTPLSSHRLVQIVAQTARELGGTAYLVGGCVRDWLVARKLSEDLDFSIINVPSQAVAKKISRPVRGKAIPLDIERGIYRIILFQSGGKVSNVTLDLCDALENDLTIDLERRDLTINAFALDPLTGELFDATGGLEDFASKTLRMVSPENLLDDPLRLLRAFRFSAQLPDFSLDESTLTCAVTHAQTLNAVSGERVRMEWLKLLSVPVAYPVVKQMADTGVLEAMIPELTACRQIPPNDYHHLNLWDHTLELIHQLDLWLPKLPEATQAFLLKPIMGGLANNLSLVRLGCLLHDVGKPETWTIDADTGRHRFIGHEAKGEEMTLPILKRLKPSNELIRQVQHLVRWHLYPCQFGPESPRKSLLKFFRRMGELTPSVVVLAIADRMSTLGSAVTEEMIDKDMESLFWLLNEYETFRSVQVIRPLLTGRDVMSLQPDVPSGPWVGEWLESLREAQEAGEVKDRRGAFIWLKRTKLKIHQPARRRNRSRNRPTTRDRSVTPDQARALSSPEP